MTRFKLFSAALVLSAVVATPAFAQWQTSEPAAYQAQYPNGDASFGPTRPFADTHAMMSPLVMHHALPMRHTKAYR
jgi:hypothetical protein